MSVVVFDVETTGLPKKRNSPFTDFDNWPHIVQMSWLVYNTINGEIDSINDYIVKLPEDITIPENAIRIHGITNEKMREQGKDICDVLMEFKRDISNSKIIVAHNLDFDTRITTGEKEIPKIRADVFFRLKQGEFITYADGKDKKVQFKLAKIEREIPKETKQYSLSDLEANFEQIYKEAKSIFE